MWFQQNIFVFQEQKISLDFFILLCEKKIFKAEYISIPLVI